MNFWNFKRFWVTFNNLIYFSDHKHYRAFYNFHANSIFKKKHDILIISLLSTIEVFHFFTYYSSLSRVSYFFLFSYRYFMCFLIQQNIIIRTLIGIILGIIVGNHNMHKGMHFYKASALTSVVSATICIASCVIASRNNTNNKLIAQQTTS